jgi:hypothetical protein
MILAWAFILLLSGFSACGQEVAQEVPVYDFEWEEFETDYDQICDITEYEKPSKVMIWLQSFGDKVYYGIYSAKEYLAAKWIAFKKLITRRREKIKKLKEQSRIHGLGQADAESELGNEKTNELAA